jgi:hypothetical protein
VMASKRLHSGDELILAPLKLATHAGSSFA